MRNFDIWHSIRSLIWFNTQFARFAGLLKYDLPDRNSLDSSIFILFSQFLWFFFSFSFYSPPKKIGLPLPYPFTGRIPIWHLSRAPLSPLCLVEQQVAADTSRALLDFISPTLSSPLRGSIACSPRPRSQATMDIWMLLLTCWCKKLKKCWTASDRGFGHDDIG